MQKQCESLFLNLHFLTSSVQVWWRLRQICQCFPQCQKRGRAVNPCGSGRLNQTRIQMMEQVRPFCLAWKMVLVYHDQSFYLAVYGESFNTGLFFLLSDCLICKCNCSNLHDLICNELCMYIPVLLFVDLMQGHRKSKTASSVFLLTFYPLRLRFCVITW